MNRYDADVMHIKFPSPHSLPIRLGGEETMRFGVIIYTIFGV
jgi:hypothetical protein